MSASTFFFNGRIFASTTAGPHENPTFADSMLVENGKIIAIGSSDEVIAFKPTSDMETRDLQQRSVLPGFIDGHMHLLLLGQSLRKLDLKHCKSLEDITATIEEYARMHPDAPTILCKNWMHVVTPNGVTAAMLDGIDPRPIFIDASSQHSLEMAMDEEAWDALVTLRGMEPDLPLRVAAYWLIKPTANLEENSRQVQRAIELSKVYNAETSPDLRIVGIKVICDGIVDACTAYLSQPYASVNSPPPIWAPEHLQPVVKEADAGGLQIALHAIGDGAIKMAIDAIERNTTPGRRHRIEHIELASPEDAKRLGDLGLTASIQPVHADPSILTEWPRLLGEDRCQRAFAYREFADAGALMAIGSDSPTSPYAPMHNLYVATTRRSARDPEYTKVVNEHFQLGMCESIVAASGGAAMSVFAEHRIGTLAEGKFADFVIVDMDWDANSLLQANIAETWFGGRKVWSR
ncbi:putative amidohydrolase YtcJ [Penicillium rolfsii]|nr:putative amidohydrolase YtcJ [Penicillium rolfsii]